MVGVFAGLASGDDAPSLIFSFTAEQKAEIYGVGLGIAGGLFGLIAGARHVHDVWAPVSPTSSAVTLVPALEHGRRGVAVRIRFR